MQSILVAGLATGALLVAGCGSAGRPSTAPTTAVPATTVPATAAPITTPATGAPTAPTSGPAPGATSPPATTAPPPVTVGVRVWFLNQHHAATGQEPLYEPVGRRVKPPAVAARGLDALFAGPTPAERSAGLRLITSGATGYRNLRIVDRIAYVTLAGGCSSGGSTMTVAGEIMPTLRQFASVTYVKIFAPDGTTASPTGPVDSIPSCLEP